MKRSVSQEKKTQADINFLHALQLDFRIIRKISKSFFMLFS